MIKKILATSFVCAGLIFSGCGESDAESQLEIQQMLDDGDYLGVIARLEGSADTQSEYIALGSAYMGAAGLSLSDLITIIADSNDNNDSDAFASFANSVDEKTASNPKALEYLGKSSDAYKQVVGDACSDTNATLTDSQRDICLYTGLSESMRATVTLGYLGDVASLADNTSDDELTASACAMQYAYDGTVPAECTKGVDSDVTFVESNSTYTTFFMTVNGNSFDYLKTTFTPGSTVITNGYCPLDSFADRNTTMTFDTKAPGYYVCPVDETGDQNLTTEVLLVDILNGGFDAVIAGVGGTGSDLASDIDNFKSEINQDANETITIDDIINYINTQN